MRSSKVWHFVLGLVLIFWGAMTLEWITFSNASDVLGAGAIAAGVLALFDK